MLLFVSPRLLCSSSYFLSLLLWPPLLLVITLTLTPVPVTQKNR